MLSFVIFVTRCFFYSTDRMPRRTLVAVSVIIVLLCVLALKPIYKQTAHIVSKTMSTDFHHYLNPGHTQGMRRRTTCTRASKDSLYIALRFRPGRTGSQLFRIYCLLALSARYCYTAVIDIQHIEYFKTVLRYFDLRNIQFQRNFDTGTFRVINNVFSKTLLQQVSQHRHNWTLSSQCFGYEHFRDKEQFIRSSARLKKYITEEVGKYVNKTFVNRSTVAIAVRRTDRVNHTFWFYNYQHSDLKWYKPFILKAMYYLKRMYSDLVFIFVSDDITWCQANFNGHDIHFSPYLSPGHDLALIARCDHLIITFGSFAWHGAWLGKKKKTVIYSKDYLPRKYTETSYLYPWWTGI